MLKIKQFIPFFLVIITYFFNNALVSMAPNSDCDGDAHHQSPPQADNFEGDALRQKRINPKRMVLSPIDECDTDECDTDGCDTDDGATTPATDGVKSLMDVRTDFLVGTRRTSR